MAEHHDHHGHTQEGGSSFRTLVIAAFVILAIVYFLAKGCTNSSEETPAQPAHPTAAAYVADRTVANS